MPDKTKIVFTDGAELVVDQPAVDVVGVLGELHRGEGGPFRAFTDAGTDVYIHAVDQIAYIKQVPESQPAAPAFAAPPQPSRHKID
jgi:hypothetical protein